MASGSALSLIIVFCMAQLWGIDWVAAGSGWQAERMTIRLIPVSAERIPALARALSGATNRAGCRWEPKSHLRPRGSETAIP